MAEQDLEQAALALDDKGQPTAGAWFDAYLDLKAAGLRWQQAAFAAWYNAPKAHRQPRTMRELAKLLNYKSEQVFYKWQGQPWFRELGIDELRQRIFQKFVADVDRKTIHAAMVEDGGAGVAARRLFYDLDRRLTTGTDDESEQLTNDDEFSDLDDDELKAEEARLARILDQGTQAGADPPAAGDPAPAEPDQ